MSPRSRPNPDGIYLLRPGLNPGQIQSYDMVPDLRRGRQVEGRHVSGSDRLGSAFDRAPDYLRRPDGSARPRRKLAAPGLQHGARPDGREGGEDLRLCGGSRRALQQGLGRGLVRQLDPHDRPELVLRQLLDTDLNGVVDDPVDLRRRWDNGLALAGETLPELLPGKTIGGNGIWYGSSSHEGDDPDSWLAEANITQIEYQNDYYRKSGDFVGLVDEWLSHPDSSGLTRYFGGRAGSDDGVGSQVLSDRRRERAPQHAQPRGHEGDALEG